jgi:hypothetical protein
MLARWKYGKDEQNNTITRMQALLATAFSFKICFIVYLYLLKFKILNRIHVSSFFIIIMKCCIHVSLSMLHSVCVCWGRGGGVILVGIEWKLFLSDPH